VNLPTKQILRLASRGTSRLFDFELPDRSARPYLPLISPHCNFTLLFLLGRGITSVSRMERVERPDIRSLLRNLYQARLLFTSIHSLHPPLEEWRVCHSLYSSNPVRRGRPSVGGTSASHAAFMSRILFYECLQEQQQLERGREPDRTSGTVHSRFLGQGEGCEGPGVKERGQYELHLWRRPVTTNMHSCGMGLTL
jgi:hypothetical protein